MSPLVELRVVVVGTPVAQGRPRFTTRGGFPRAYDPPKSREWKQHAAALYRLAMTAQNVDQFPEGRPVEVELLAVFPRPKAERNRPMGRKVTKPDVENIAKAAMDAATGIVYADDAQVTDLIARKRIAGSGATPCVIVTFRA